MFDMFPLLRFSLQYNPRHNHPQLPCLSFAESYYVNHLIFCRIFNSNQPHKWPHKSDTLQQRAFETTQPSHCIWCMVSVQRLIVLLVIATIILFQETASPPYHIGRLIRVHFHMKATPRCQNSFGRYNRTIPHAALRRPTT